MGVFGAYYRNVGRRFSTLLLTVTVGAYLFDLTFNKGTEAIWDWNNQGKQWKDIKKNFEEQ